MKVYQIINVNICAGINAIIPDPCIYSNYKDAMENIKKRKLYFQKAGEQCEYKGMLHSLADVRYIINHSHFDIKIEKTIFYIYVLEVR